jgi:hypothetical protein
MDSIEVQGEDVQATEPSKRTRRVWTAEEKLRIVREARRPGAVKQEVAKRHGVYGSVPNRWRTEQLSRTAVARRLFAARDCCQCRLRPAAFQGSR